MTDWPTDADERMLAKMEELQALQAELNALDGHAPPPLNPELLPHQVAPGGDWLLWLLLGGRGTGKSLAGSYHMDQHAKGPPCYPGGHRMAIIAPTLGDASESCVNSPAGLKAIEPGVKLQSTAGGTHLFWPSGRAVAKLFGAYSKEDIERLRAGGNRCVAAGTLVRTEFGEVPIENVRVGDRVWTRNGLRRVLRAGVTGYRACVTAVVGARTLRVTPDHEVWNPRCKQWAPITKADTLAVWRESSWLGMVSGGTSAMTGITATAGMDCSTVRYSRRTMGRSQPAGTCITSTTIRPTTTPAISQSWIRSLIGPNTPESVGPTGISREPMRLLPLGERARTSSVHALRAERSSLARIPAGGIAVTGVGIMAPRHVRSSNGCALCAATNSPPPHGGPVRLVALPVEQLSPPTLAEPVYDLQVEHDHEFFANGVLVSNCFVWCEELMAWRYLQECWDHMIFGLRLGRDPRIIASTTPKPVKWLKDLIAEVTTVTTHGTTDDNPHLPKHIRRGLYARYKGTVLERQELLGEIIEYVEGALWEPELISESRSDPEYLVRKVLGIDPNVTGERTSDEVGMVLAGVADVEMGLEGDGSESRFGAPAEDDGEDDGEDLDTETTSDGRKLLRQAWILGDYSGKKPPEIWAKEAVDIVVEWRCSKIVAEVNNGGDLVGLVIKAECEKRGGVAIKVPRKKPDGTKSGYDWVVELPSGHVFTISSVWSKVNKHLRAEPQALRYRQGRVHHAGVFAQLEGEMTTWVPGEESPNRLDALVFALTELLGGSVLDAELEVSSPLRIADSLPKLGTGSALAGITRAPSVEVWVPTAPAGVAAIAPSWARPRGWG